MMYNIYVNENGKSKQYTVNPEFFKEHSISYLAEYLADIIKQLRLWGETRYPAMYVNCKTWSEVYEKAVWLITVCAELRDHDELQQLLKSERMKTYSYSKDEFMVALHDFTLDINAMNSYGIGDPSDKRSYFRYEMLAESANRLCKSLRTIYAVLETMKGEEK